jgi:hypothetical protein
MLSFPLLETELFSSHWDDDWDIIDLAKDNGKSSQGDNASQRASDNDARNGKRDDKEHGNDVHVDEIREDISKVIEDVMRTGIDQDVATSSSGSRRSSSSAELRRRQLLPSQKSESSRRGMSALELASSPPTSFEIYHNHQPIRGRRSHPLRLPISESNKLAETIEYTPEASHLSPTLRYLKTFSPRNIVVRPGAGESDKAPTKEDSSEEASSEEDFSDDEEESSEEDSVGDIVSK